MGYVALKKSHEYFFESYNTLHFRRTSLLTYSGTQKQDGGAQSVLNSSWNSVERCMREYCPRGISLPHGLLVGLCFLPVARLDHHHLELYLPLASAHGRHWLDAWKRLKFPAQPPPKDTLSADVWVLTRALYLALWEGYSRVRAERLEFYWSPDPWAHWFGFLLSCSAFLDSLALNCAQSFVCRSSLSSQDTNWYKLHTNSPVITIFQVVHKIWWKTCEPKIKC